MSLAPWDNEPIELPDGRLVCPHGLVTCGICTVDYSFMDEVLGYSGEDDAEDESDTLDGDEYDDFDDDDEDDDDEDLPPPWGTIGYPSHPPRSFRPTREVRPGEELRVCKRFTPPQRTSTPRDVFNHAEGTHRFSRRFNGKDEILLYTDGACLDNGRDNARGGCAFVFRPVDPELPEGHDYVNFWLERKGPKGAVVRQTSNRAELRAVIAALKFRWWQGEGWNRAVIATDSAYVVDGMTRHMNAWLRRGWRTVKGTEVVNKDLWVELLSILRELETYDFEVLFWHIPRELNGKADMAAKDAAKEESSERYQNISGVLC